MTDTERMDWLQQARATVYKSELTPGHWVVVDERRATRQGCLGKTLRDAIDGAANPPK